MQKGFWCRSLREKYLGRPLLGGKDNIRLYALEGGCKVVHWTHLAQHSTVFGLKASAFINCEKRFEQLIN